MIKNFLSTFRNKISTACLQTDFLVVMFVHVDGFNLISQRLTFMKIYFCLRNISSKILIMLKKKTLTLIHGVQSKNLKSKNDEHINNSQKYYPAFYFFFLNVENVLYIFNFIMLLSKYLPSFK